MLKKIFIYGLIIVIALIKSSQSKTYSFFDFFNTKPKPAQQALDEFELIDHEENVPAGNQKRVNYLNLERNKWMSISPIDLNAKFGVLTFRSEYNKSGVRSNEIYVPQNVKSNFKPLVFFVIHGTFATEAKEYYSEESYFYKSVRDFAQQQAQKKQTPVEIISLRWSGYNLSAARLDGGKVLASLLNDFYNDYESTTIAHSHGCNVVNAASRFIATGVKIEQIIQIAAPVRDVVEPEFKPRNFGKLYQFYSSSDLVAAIGSIILSWDIFRSSGSIRKFDYQKNHNIYNIRTQINGKNPGHTPIKEIITFLPEILDIINEHYKFNTDLDLDVNTTTNTVLISVRHYLNAQLNDLIFRNVLKTDNPTAEQKYYVASQFALESQFSEQQKRQFSAQYGKGMEEKGWLLSKLF